ncbi:unnamed protein product [Pelagomonas calceolata]|uniref:Uncharacterized protein n=3 Tax=Pelagomonas calceolata TaxID=35677 RepID=A0A8J2WPE9_9STRA|nr:unnamed protein product [Pelagomonas calceolata]
MNPAEVALAQLDVLLDEQEAVAPAAACPTRRRVGNPTNEAPASLPEAVAAALKRRREQQPDATIIVPEGPRTRKRVRVAPPPVAEFAVGAEVEALWEGKWYPGVVAEVVVELEVYYEIAWADGYYQNRIRAVSRSGEKLVRRRAPAAAVSLPAAAAPALKRRRQQPTSAVVAAAPPPLRAAAVTGDWCVVGTHVEDSDDATVRGVITGYTTGWREVATTTGSVVMIRPSKLTRTTLTDEETARCVRPASHKDYVQARIDGLVRFSHGGREFKNRFTCADGTERRQFVVTATHVRCALCPDGWSWSLETDILVLLGNLKNHCGQTSGQRPSAQLHRERLASAAAAPPVATTDEAGTVLGISHAQARQLATAAAAGCLIVRDTSQALSAVESPFWRAMRTTQRLPSDAALEAMTGTQLRKLMARRGVGRGPQDRKADFIDKLKARAAGETYVNKPYPVTGDWCIVGAQVAQIDDSTVRGVIIDCPKGWREVTTTTGAVVMLNPRQLTEATLTEEEAALCVRPASQKDYVQARIDGIIRFSRGGREFKNRFTCADGTERRQFVVTATHVRCALCPDGWSWSLETDILMLLENLKNHCGQTSRITAARLHRERLASAAAGIVLGVSRAQAHRLLPRDARGCFPCPAGCPRTFQHAPAAVQHAKSCAAGKRSSRLNPPVPRSVARRSGRARPPDAIVETKTDDDDVDDATAKERNRRLAEEIGAPVCLWGGADVRREREEAMDPEAKRPRTEAPWARWDQSSENDSASPRPSLPPPPRAPADSEAVTAAAPPPPRPPAPRAAPQCIDLTREDSEDGTDPPTPPGDDGYSSSSSECSVESVGGQYVPEPPGPAPPNRTWDTRRGAWVDAAEEFEAWMAQHVPVARHARLRDVADSLADLRCCDIDDLDDALELSQWSEPERRRFMDACSSL